MRKLLFDLKATQPNISGKRHGGGRYAEIVFFRMVELNVKFSCFYDSSKWINPEIKRICKERAIPLYDICGDTIENIIKQNKIDRLYSALPYDYAKLTCCEVFGTIHGMRELETPFDNYFYRYKNSFKAILKFTLKKIFKNIYLWHKRKLYVDRYIMSSFHFVTVSEHSYYALLSYFPKMRSKDLKVFYSPNTSLETDARCKKSDECYFLLVSGNRWEKNNLRAIIAFDRLISNRLLKDVRMKITGANANNFRYKVKNPGSFDFLGYVSDEELNSLYSNAYLFVYPSLNEGFGYPPMEAMKYKVPVIASPFTSMAEICDSGALYFNPLLIEEIMGRMLMMMDKDRYTEYSERGYKQYLKIKQRQERDLDLLIEYITK